MWNGLTTRAFVEKDSYAQKILRKNFAGIPIYDDICTFDGKPYAGTWLLTGGFPCQPFSLAGKRAGASDDRALWPEMCRVIDEAKPCWVLGENVPGIISMELDRVLADLESLGYSAWPIIIPACALDAGHRRDRVWIVAYSASGQDNGRKCGDVADSEGRGQSLNAAADARRENVADAESQGLEGWTLGGDARTNLAGLGKSGGAVFANWQPEPAVGRVANGIPNRVDRLKGLGNAIVPQVAAQLIHAMVRMENAKLTGGG